MKHKNDKDRVLYAIDKKRAELMQERDTIENARAGVEAVAHLSQVNARLVTSIKKHGRAEHTGASLQLDYAPRLTLYFAERVYKHEEILHADGSHNYDAPDYFANTSAVIYFNLHDNARDTYAEIISNMDARIAGIDTGIELLDADTDAIDAILQEHRDIAERQGAFNKAHTYATRDACKGIYYGND